MHVMRDDGTCALLASSSGAWGLPPELAGMGGYVIASLLVMGAVTVALRWAPFGFVRALGDSEILRALGRTMPVGVMVALVAFTMAGAAEEPGPFWPAVAALVLTVALQLWRRSMVLSIFGGTAAYMVLVNLVV